MTEYFYTPPGNIDQRQAVISGEEARHIARALRHKRGDRITVVDGQGREYHCAIAAVSDNSVTATIVTITRKSREPVHQVTLAQAVPKGQRMDFVVEKGTEIGLAAIIPLECANSVVRRDDVPAPAFPNNEDNEPPGRAGRWQRIAIAAMKQSLRSVLPAIAEPTSFEQLMARAEDFDLIVMADEGEKKRTVAQAFEAIPPQKDVRRTLCIVGPEGGFTAGERDAALRKRANIVTLGARRLRAETAGIVLATLVLDRLHDLE